MFLPLISIKKIKHGLIKLLAGALVRKIIIKEKIKQKQNVLNVSSYSNGFISFILINM